MVKKRAGKGAKKRAVADRGGAGDVRVVLAVGLLAYVLVFAIAVLFPGVLRAEEIYVSAIGMLLLSLPLFVVVGAVLGAMTLKESLRGEERILAILQLASVVVGVAGTLMVAVSADWSSYSCGWWLSVFCFSDGVVYAVMGAIILTLGASGILTGVLAGVVTWNGRRGKQDRGNK